MQGKIALEEHFAIADTLQEGLNFLPEDYWPELEKRLLDIHEYRLGLMDQHGIDVSILSLNAPTVQAIWNVDEACALATKANDYLAEQVQKRPDRFQAFAALPMQDPERAARELQRCVKTLGFRGALVNGFSQIGQPDNMTYLDHPMYRGFWSVVQDLDVPFYLHPRNPLPSASQIYDGHPWLLGATWAFGQETAVHALRLMASGLFDEYPRLSIVLGHMGEGLPYSLWRADNRAGWVTAPKKYPAKRTFSEYFQQNFYLTTAGNCRTQSLIDAVLEIGSDRIMFSTDWPFENIDHAAKWFDQVPLSTADLRKIGRDNAMRLFRL